MVEETIRYEAPPPSAGAPDVRLIDARAGGLDQEGLRARAREISSSASFASRSYCFPWALVALHAAPVGVDIERISSCEESFADSIRTPAERAAGWPGGEVDRHVTALWCSKEALSKALGDARDYDPRRLEGPGAWPHGRAGPWRAAPLQVDGEHVAWLCWREPQDAAPAGL
jgi:phosphopantetheinyl transferase